MQNAEAIIVNMKHIKDLCIAKEMGARDYWDYMEKADNPYKIASLRVAWEEGWEEADLEFKEFSDSFYPPIRSAEIIPFKKKA